MNAKEASTKDVSTKDVSTDEVSLALVAPVPALLVSRRRMVRARAEAVSCRVEAARAAA